MYKLCLWHVWTFLIKLSLSDDKNQYYVSGCEQVSKNLIKEERTNENLTQIPTDLPTDITYLDISGNYISSSECQLNDELISCFDLYEKLQTLQVNNNKLFSISQLFPNKVSSVKNLSLAENTLDENVFKYLRNLGQLKILNLNHNFIRSIPYKSFFFSPCLEEIVISQNQLKVIDSNAFLGLKSLTTLDLWKNEIKDIRREMFQPLESIDIIGLQFNPIICTCSVSQFADYIYEKNISPISPIECHQESENTSMNISDQKLKDLCEVEENCRSIDSIELKLESIVKEMVTLGFHLNAQNISNIFITFTYRIFGSSKTVFISERKASENILDISGIKLNTYIIVCAKVKHCNHQTCLEISKSSMPPIEQSKNSDECDTFFTLTVVGFSLLSISIISLIICLMFYKLKSSCTFFKDKLKKDQIPTHHEDIYEDLTNQPNTHFSKNDNKAEIQLRSFDPNKFMNSNIQVFKKPKPDPKTNNFDQPIVKRNKEAIPASKYILTEPYGECSSSGKPSLQRHSTYLNPEKIISTKENSVEKFHNFQNNMKEKNLSASLGALPSIPINDQCYSELDHFYNEPTV